VDQPFFQAAPMNPEKHDDAFSLLTGDLPEFARSLGNGSAVGLSGSRARGSGDALSDIDICVYVAGDVPSPPTRKRLYASLGLADSIYEDVDFEFSRGDGFRVHGTRCDFNWMSIPAVRSFLQRLETDFDCPEFIPGGLSAVKALHDPGRIIAGLQGEIPQYSDARAQHRIRKAVRDAHFSLYDLGWLKKAALRNDCFLFLKHQFLLLDALFQALFALNHEWLSDEKGLARRVAAFTYVPMRMETRMHSIILHQHEDGGLKDGLSNLKGLFADTVQSIHQRYPQLDLPVDWK
jgi:predicted nucleotidyltransferase